MRHSGPILGAHMSIAGGCYRAVERAAEAGCDCVQLFSKNNNQWRAKPLNQEDAQRFQEALAEHNITHPVIHDSYLINLASPDKDLWKKSVQAFIEELERAELLGIPYVITHPGSYTTSSEEAGLARVAEALDEVHQRTAGIEAECLLELTAGQGTNLGWRFEHLASILEMVEHPERLGVCWDTCHVFAAGYDTSTKRKYNSVMREFDRLIGIERIKAFHLNDSKRELGSRVDRHEHIGEGHVGLHPFGFLLKDRRFGSVPMYLETPKGNGKDHECDIRNLATLRELAGA